VRRALQLEPCLHVRVTAYPPLCDTPTVFYKLQVSLKHDHGKKKTKPASEALSRARGGKQWTWTRPFARSRPSSTSDEEVFLLRPVRLITAVISISRTQAGDYGAFRRYKNPTTATVMRKRQSHCETKRAPRRKRLKRRVENDGNFSARWFV